MNIIVDSIWIYGLTTWGMIATFFLLMVLWFMRGPSFTLFRARFSPGSSILLVEDETGVVSVDIVKHKKTNVLEGNKVYGFLPRKRALSQKIAIGYKEVLKDNDDGTVDRSVVPVIESDENYWSRIEKEELLNELVTRKTILGGLGKPLFLCYKSTSVAAGPTLVNEMEETKAIDDITRGNHNPLVKKLIQKKIKERLGIVFYSINTLKEFVNFHWSITSIDEVKSEAYQMGLDTKPDKPLRKWVLPAGLITIIFIVFVYIMIFNKANVI